MDEETLIKFQRRLSDAVRNECYSFNWPTIAEFVAKKAVEIYMDLMKGPQSKLEGLQECVSYLLDNCPFTIRDNSGELSGARGVEDISGSLALTFKKMQQDLTSGLLEISRLGMLRREAALDILKQIGYKWENGQWIAPVVAQPDTLPVREIIAYEYRRNGLALVWYNRQHPTYGYLNEKDGWTAHPLVLKDET